MPVTVFLLLLNYLVFDSQVLVAGLFALPFDLVLGYAGIVSLGYADSFRLGACTTRLLTAHGWGEPLIGLAAGVVVATLAGFRASLLVVRGQDLIRLMVTLGIGLMLYEAASKMAFLAGDVSDLFGVAIRNLLGTFEFDLGGRMTYFYSPVVLFLVPVGLRRLVHSPFGLSLRGIQQGPKRIPTIGVNVRMWLVATFTVSAAVAGVIGRLLAQTTQFISLDSLGFSCSTELLIMSALSGAGRLCDAPIGAAVFMIAQNVLVDINSIYWQFWIGLLLMVIMLFVRGGVLSGLETAVSTVRTRRARKGGTS